MNIKTSHPPEKQVSAVSFFQGEECKAIALQILENQELKEHITKIPALLLCVSGEAIFENEQGKKELLKAGDYITIEPFVKHRVSAATDSQLLLLR